MHMGQRLLQLHFVLLSEVEHPVLPVEAHSDGFIGLYEVVEFLGEVVILRGEHSDVVVEGVDLGLEVGVVVQEGGVGVAGAVEFLAHLDDLVFSDADLGFKVFDGRGQV